MKKVLLIAIAIGVVACDRNGIRDSKAVIEKNRYIKRMLQDNDERDACKFESKNSIVKAVKGKIGYTERLNLDLGSDEEEQDNDDEIIGKYKKHNKKNTAKNTRHDVDDDADENEDEDVEPRTRRKKKSAHSKMDDDEDWECVVYRKKDYKN